MCISLSLYIYIYDYTHHTVVRRTSSRCWPSATRPRELIIIAITIILLNT